MALSSHFHQPSFAILFLIAFTCAGGWLTVVPAFIIAWIIQVGLRKWVLNKILPIPRGGAILITGTSTGIGAATARQLAIDGWIVFAGVRRAEDGDKLRESLSDEAKARLIPLLLDITSSAAITSAVTSVTSHLRQHDGILMGIINNAGYMEKGVVEMLDVEKWRQQFEVNLFGTVAITQAFLPLLRATTIPGYTKRIIMISSGLGRSVFPTTGAYAATKHALEALTHALRQELQHWPIDTIVVNPGVIGTNFEANVEKSFRTNFDNSNVSQEVRDWYAQCITKADAEGAKVKRQSPDVVVTEIKSALADSRPFQRYFAGSDVAFTPIGNCMPDLWQDKIVAHTFR